MKISSEARVGIIGIVTIAVLVWGINYLKGRNILSSTYSLYTFFQDAGGLEESAPVMMSGIKVGYVDQIDLLPAGESSVRVIMNIENDFKLGGGSRCELFSSDLIGTKAIRIISEKDGEPAGHNDTIPSSVEPDMLESLRAQITPLLEKTGTLAVSLDTLAMGLNRLIQSGETSKAIRNLSEVSESLRRSLAAGGSLETSFSSLASFSEMLDNQQDKVSSLIGHLNEVSSSLENAELDQLSEGLISLTLQFELLLEQLNSGEGTAGKLLYSDSLYDHLDRLIVDLDHLVKDLNEHPEDYVQISVFGGSKRK